MRRPTPSVHYREDSLYDYFTETQRIRVFCRDKNTNTWRRDHFDLAGNFIRSYFDVPVPRTIPFGMTK